jgi:hypothetical protein
VLNCEVLDCCLCRALIWFTPNTVPQAESILSETPATPSLAMTGFLNL